MARLTPQSLYRPGTDDRATRSLKCVLRQDGNPALEASCKSSCSSTGRSELDELTMQRQVILFCRVIFHDQTHNAVGTANQGRS